MSTKITPRPYRILKEDTQAALIDVQVKLSPLIAEADVVIKKILLCIKGLQALSIPIMLNEQYPQGLGHTIPEILEVLNTDNQKAFEKKTFSVCDTDTSWNHLAQQNKHNVILFGIEAHVCVQQTALDLLDNGLQPILLVDAVGSRVMEDKNIAIDRMRKAGVVITTTEAILFELCRRSDDAAFKQISQLIKSF